LARAHAMKAVEQLFGFFTGLAFQALRHHRSRRFGDRTTRALKANVLNGISVHLEKDGEAITAERIEAFRFVVGGFQFAIIPGRLAMLQNYFLVEIAQISHQAKTSSTFLMPRTSASISSFVLYRAKEARAVASIPKRSITGCAQWWPVRIAIPSWSRIVPMSCGWTPSIINESTPAFSLAVPTMRTPGIAETFCVAYSSNSCSYAAMLSMPRLLRYSIAARKPTAPDMSGVPASNLCGTLL